MCFKYWFCEQQLTQRTMKNFLVEIYSKPPKKITPPQNWCLSHWWRLVLRYTRFERLWSNKDFRYILVAIDSCIKFGWTVLLKTKNAQTITDSFEIFLITSKTKPNLYETDRGEKFYNIFFQNFLNNNMIKHYSRKNTLTAVCAARFNRTVRYLLKWPVFERGIGNWVDILPAKTKRNNNSFQSSIKLLSIQSSLKRTKDLPTKLY